jgi:hypothetical protein
MHLRLALAALFGCFHLFLFSQNEDDLIFNVKRTQKPVTKKLVYQKIGPYGSDTAISNLIIATPDSFNCYSYNLQRNPSGQLTGDINKNLLFCARYTSSKDSLTLSYQQASASIEKRGTIFKNMNMESSPVNFSWPQFFNGTNPEVNQSAVFIDKKVPIKIDSGVYECYQVVYLRDTMMRNQLPIKIKGRRWNAKGFHKEVIATHVYLRCSDYLPVKVVELFPEKQAINYNYQPWAAKNTWELKRSSE